MTAGVQNMQTDMTECPRNKRCEASRRYCEKDWLLALMIILFTAFACLYLIPFAS